MKMSKGNQSNAIIIQQKCNFSTKVENRRREQVLSGGLVPVGGEGGGEWLYKFEYGANFVYICM
jgi:hypothetical protein